jgi:hypothetical protein
VCGARGICHCDLHFVIPARSTFTMPFEMIIFIVARGCCGREGTIALGGGLNRNGLCVLCLARAAHRPQGRIGALLFDLFASLSDYHSTER